MKAVSLSLSLLVGLSSIAEAQGTWRMNQDPWGVLPIHMILLPNKSLLIFNRSRPGGGGGEADFGMQLIAPGASGDYAEGGDIFYPTINSAVRELFCAGHTLDEDGNVFLSGGHAEPGTAGDAHGIRDNWFYKWSEGTSGLHRMADMLNGRWYPTAIQLPDRTMMTLMGSYCGGSNENAEGECPEHGSMYTVRNIVPELWTAIPGSSSPTNHIESLLARDMNLFYPHMFIQPTDGRVFFAASGRPGSGVDGFQQSAIFNNQTLSWSNYLTIPSNPFANVRRTWPSSVMVDGVIYRSGGSVTDAPNDNAVASTVKIDLNASSPTWNAIDEMERGRKNHTLVALPDGRIVAMGGNEHGAIAGGAERTRPEALDTEASNPTWTFLQEQPSSGAEPLVPRGYHSTALLLPDASIVLAGGEKESATSWATQKRAHFFTPEYGGDSDWKDHRPAVLASDPTPPTVIRYGEAFELSIDVAQGRELAKVRLISLGATTHAFNQNQQFVTLSFTESSTNGVYVVDPPASPNKATPGYYMLFALDDERVPSVAHIVQLKDFARAFPNSVTIGSGTSAQSTPTLQETVLGDNKYIGTRLDSNPQDPNVASLSAVANVASGSYSKVRLSIEMRSSTSSSFTWYLKNYSTSAFDLVHSGSCTTSDALYVDITTSSGASPYVSSSGEIMATCMWTNEDPVPFYLYVDKIEFGVR